MFEVSLTSSYSVGRACLLLLRCHGDHHTNHTDYPVSPQSCLASQENRYCKRNDVKFWGSMSNNHRESKHPKIKTPTCVCWQVCIHINTDELCFVYVVVCMCNMPELYCMVYIYYLHEELEVKSSTSVMH